MSMLAVGNTLIEQIDSLPRFGESFQKCQANLWSVFEGAQISLRVAWIARTARNSVPELRLHGLQQFDRTTLHSACQ